MNKIYKPIVALLVGLFLMAGNVVALPQEPTAASPANMPETVEACMAPASINFSANNACFLPAMGLFVVIDSVDCAVDVLGRTANAWTALGRYTTDVFKGRHDLKNILRPKSVITMGDKLIVLASAQTDSSFLAIIDLASVSEQIQPVAQVGFPCNAFACQVNELANEIVVLGKNPVGYDINTVSLAAGIEGISASSKFHYHVPKQSEVIQQADPKGAGLAIVCIVVVFLALVIIVFIMNFYSTTIRKVQEGKPTAAASTDADVYAAIAAALYRYQEEQHDEEETILTIQKVERAWTPWNAKYYNMNHFFSNRGK